MTSRIDLTRYDSYESSAATISSAASVATSVPDVKHGQRTTSVRPVVSKEMVDQAVEKVLSARKMSPQNKVIYERLLASDTEAAFAVNYYMGKSDVKVLGYRSLEKRVVNITPVLTPEETAEMVGYAPEYDLHFLDAENHDHGAAAAMRVVDTEVLSDMIPGNVPFKDVGGNPLHYIMKGDVRAHVCGTNIDPKDPSRATVRMMRAKRIMDDPNRSREQRSMASRYVHGDKSFCCGLRGEECMYKAPVVRSIHVYDVPIDVWPRIMDNAGACLLQGCLLFPQSAYVEREGKLQCANAVYSVDVSKNLFTMGFIDSPSQMYSHNWLNYMRYGVDQIIPMEGGRYSYKITQRRADTVFFDYVKVAGVGISPTPVYKLPGVPMVHINGFELTEVKADRNFASLSRQPMRRKQYWFPAPLWQDMKRQAELDFERGVMDFKKLFNYYRTVSPRNTINGVLISGGYRVSADMMTPLVVHVGMAAAMSVLAGQHTSKALISGVMLDRMRADSGVFGKAFRAGLNTLKAVGKLVTWPVRSLCDYMQGLTDEALMNTLIQWEQRPVVQEVPFASLVTKGWFTSKVGWSLTGMEVEDSLRPYQQQAEQSDHERALSQAGVLKSIVDVLYADDPEGLLKSGDSAVGGPAAISTSGLGDTTVVADEEEIVVDRAKEESRRSAISECLEESELEERKLEEFCEKVIRACTDPTGAPVLAALNSNAEAYGEPDLWYINRGVLVKSAQGIEGAECRHSAVYTLQADFATGSRFRTLRDVEGQEGEEYRAVTDSGFTGWALTIERLLIFNGPEIRETLQRALTVSHGYTVVQVQGPPGCGKTYSIIQRAKHGDVIQCPVRESSRDTRNKLLKKDPGYPMPNLTITTVDSYLKNYGWDTRRQELTTKALLADECFMAHSGSWYASAGLLCADKVYAYGDSEQIPHIPRVDAPSVYVRILPDRVEYVWLSYRCPWDAVAAYNHLYDYKVRSKSDVKKSMRVVQNWRELVIPKGELVILYMYHATYKELRKDLGDSFFARKNVRHMSVHQAEGKTFENVWLFRHDTRARNDKISLYDKPAYALVAISRHTKSFSYVRPRNLGDCIDTWIENAKDVRAVAAAGDVSSAGTSVRYL